MEVKIEIENEIECDAVVAVYCASSTVRLDFERIRCEVIYAASMGSREIRGVNGRKMFMCEFIKCEHCQIAVVRLT